MASERYSVDDLIIPILAACGELSGNTPEPKCHIEVEVRDDDVVLRVGPRDWQWRRPDGSLLGAGTCLFVAETAQVPDIVRARMKGQQEDDMEGLKPGRIV